MGGLPPTGAYRDHLNVNRGIRLSPAGTEALVNLRWQIVEKGIDATDYDLAGIERIEYLLTVYGSQS